MGAVIDIAIVAAIAAVAVVLGFGLFSLYRGSDEDRSRSNKLMRLRVALQALAVVLLVLGFWWKQNHGG